MSQDTEHVYIDKLLIYTDERENEINKEKGRWIEGEGGERGWLFKEPTEDLEIKKIRINSKVNGKIIKYKIVFDKLKEKHPNLFKVSLSLCHYSRSPRISSS